MHQSIDVITDLQHDADLFSSKCAGILNKHSGPSFNPLLPRTLSLTSSYMFEDLCYTEDNVTEAICQHKSKRSLVLAVSPSSEHLPTLLLLCLSHSSSPGLSNMDILCHITMGFDSCCSS